MESFRSSSRPPKCTSHLGIGLVQIDGSQHPWLEDRGPKLALLIAVDDATGAVAQKELAKAEALAASLMVAD